MPELPEVQTTLSGIKPHIVHQKIKSVTVRHPRLRWPIPPDLSILLKNKVITHIERRAKYLIITVGSGHLIIHLGMSGRLTILTEPRPPGKHDHFEMVFANQKTLRFTDPRRFGAILWTNEDINQHPLLKHLGVEPLNRGFTGKHLFDLAQKRKQAVKPFIMDNKIVVGVGNIYATEALFDAKIHPLSPAGTITLAQYNTLVKSIKKILRAAIKQGGTTLKDFTKSDGKPGYFSVHLKAYGRTGLPCVRCRKKLQSLKIGQRSTVFCAGCQSL